MLPAILAKQLQRGMKDYITTTFPMTNEPFRGSLASLFANHAVMHEPYIAVKMPFRHAETMPDYFTGVELPFVPYVHQLKSYERLLQAGGRSTLITTGTGSGKTECFLNPVLEYCYQHRQQMGIKALIIYPMNALALDQAGRIAKAIHDSTKLREAGITAGLYIGNGRGRGNKKMSEPSKQKDILGVITDHEAMIQKPPDILLTNYKMLDYLLVRPKDAGLWRDNRPDTLKFIVVDEFHTFDGAQGTDLACLLRRLKARLYTPPGYLCCVGTSATMGENQKGGLQYAAEVFGEPFDEDAVITEDRLRPEEFFAHKERRYTSLPSAEAVADLARLTAEDDEMAYLQAAVAAWLPETDLHFGKDDMESRLALGNVLSQHVFLQDLLTLMQGKYWQESTLLEKMCAQYPQLSAWQAESQNAGLDALFSLISYARSGNAENPRPFLFVQVQLWARELRRLLGRVSASQVDYMLAPDLNAEQKPAYLPVINCRDCGATGWAGILDERQQVHVRSLETFYNLFFKASEKVVFIYPGKQGEANKILRPAKFCTTCHHLCWDTGLQECPNDQGELMSVMVTTGNQETSGTKRHRQHVCPFCGSHRGISLMGVRSTTEISASLSQLMASRFNDDKKALAFSDSVQDAAYRAGFFNSRTWRFGLRGAIQHYLLHGDGEGKSLDAFTKGFIAYWQMQMSPEQFVSFFIPPNLTWRNAYQNLREHRVWQNGKEEKALWADIQKRIAYEIMLEYGVTSRIGRTLAKSGCSHLTFHEQDIVKLADLVQTCVENELSEVKTMDPLAFQQMVTDWLHLLRQSGAFDDKVFYTFCEQSISKYSPYHLRPRPYYWWLPSLQSGRNSPRFLCQKQGGGKLSMAFESCDAKRYTGMIQDYLDARDLMRADLPRDISKIILRCALQLGLVREMPLKLNRASIHVYGLAKERIYVTKMQDMPLDYYGKLYSSGDLVRIHAFEHTSLLERANREQIETGFKDKGKAHQPWEPNVLSCTPTLELGIDIGDLSSVILCSVPPGQAQFLQRSGRAGRTDGNSFILAIANTRPHDLYFYADPLEMIQGIVAPPHIFLKASAVLARQFTAFCMDNWVKSGVAVTAIPAHLGQALNNIKNESADKFPYNFLRYVQQNLRTLFLVFLRLFEFDKTKDSQLIEELKQFAYGNGLTEKSLQNNILQSFAEVKEQINSINHNVRLLDDMLRQYREKTQDSSHEEVTKELEGEKRALLAVEQNIKKKDIFNFLSDEGLLPNYAFPEDGITLKAVLFRRDDEGATAKQQPQYHNQVYEYQRSASSAISELAPNNTFYAGGHHFTINQVDLHTAKPEAWRLCPNCAHAARESELSPAEKRVCPHCGSAMWGDRGQVRTMLKVKMVYSNMDLAKSLIDDGSESRNVCFYTKQLLVDVDADKDVLCAYDMSNEDFPFGYEFVQKAVIREINFGEADIARTEEVMVNGQQAARKGFRLCKYCGRLCDENGKIHHAPYCRMRKQTGGLTPQDAEEECLFLYREFQTEVLRLLIPETTSVETKIKTESFTAAFMLGMKEYFGNVDHLRAAVCEVPVAGADYRKQYLVIYDSVPGGTGYLKQMMQQEHALTDIFEKALTVLENCSCKDDPHKDGCYHCLYAYRQSNEIGSISRRTAIQLLRSLLSGKGNRQKIAKLDNVAINPLFDSELERRFILALAQIKVPHCQTTMKQILVHGKPGYRLEITRLSADGTKHVLDWEVEPQVLLAEEQGVTIKCKPDFVLWSKFADQGEHLPVAVFTDGFTYHKDIAADDTLKREAIRRSGNYLIWSLSYKDVQWALHKADVDYATNTLDFQQMPSASVYQKAVTGDFKKIQPESMSAMEMLFSYLSLPQAETIFKRQANAYSMALLSPASRDDVQGFVKWHQQMSQIQQATLFTTESFLSQQTIFGKWIPQKENPLSCYLAGMSLLSKKHQIAVAAVLEDRENQRGITYEQEWNGFWHFCNLMQFAPCFVIVTETGLENQIYLSLAV